jgi:endo-1,4-beta-xylanase
MSIEFGAGKETLGAHSRVAEILPAATAIIMSFTVAVGGAGNAEAARSKTNSANPKTVPAMNGEIRMLGVAIEAEDLDDAEHAKFLAKNFKEVVTENNIKTSVVMPESRWQRDHSGLNKIVSFASEKKLKVRGHPVLFGKQDPLWINRIGDRCADKGLFKKPISEGARKEMSEFKHEHINSLVKNYKGKIDEWDVVNEPLKEDGSSDNTSYNKCSPGIDHIVEAFKLAHDANKDAKLYINEINAELPGPKRDGLVKLARELLDRGVPLYGIGLQTHLNLDFDYKGEDMEGFKETMRIFRSMGLAVKLTEMDVSIGKNPTKAQYARQYKIFTSVIKACTEEKACVGALVWGATDDAKHTWLNASGTLAYRDGRLKPAHKKIVRMFELSNKPQNKTRTAKSKKIRNNR